MKRAVLASLLVLMAVSASPAAARVAHAHPLKPTKGTKNRFEIQGAVLPRPDDAQTDPTGTHKWSGPEAKGGPNPSPYCTAHFCVHWTNVGIDASDYSHAQEMGNILENEVYACENGIAPLACAGSPGLGWRDAAPDYGLGGDDRTDVYIEDLFDTEKVYGYTALDPGQVQNPAVPHFAYMVMDNDYSRFGAKGGATGIAAERVTAAHEYNHVLQNAYDYLEDPWMLESTAVYMEDKVYPDINDYLQYISAWIAHGDEPLTKFSDDRKPYGSAVWNHWLDHRYGAGLIRNAWEGSTSAGDFAPGAYGMAISGAGGGGFSDEFDRFAAAVAEWNVPGSGFPDHYPDMPRNGPLPVETQTYPFTLAHTTFDLFDVPVPADAPPTIRLTATLPAGTAGAVALVGRTGGDLNGGTVTSNLTPVPGGGTGAVQLDQPSQYGRITAVVVNSDPSKAGFDQQAGDYIFTKDASGVVARVQKPGPPVPTTGAPGTVHDHDAFVDATVDPHLEDTRWSIEYGRTPSYGRTTGWRLLPASTVGAASLASDLRGLDARALYHYRVIASNAAGIATGADMLFRTARDVTPPKIALRVTRQNLRGVRRHGLRYRLRCSERCHGMARLVIAPGVAHRLGLPQLLAKQRVRLRPRQALSSLRMRVRGAVVQRLSADKKVTARLGVELSDGAGNRRTAVRRLALTR